MEDKHSLNEIIDFGEDCIVNLTKKYIATNDVIKVLTAIPHKEDGVSYGYDVFFKKVVKKSGRIGWQFIKYQRVV